VILTCAITILVGFPSSGLNKDDRAALKTATKRCTEIYPEAPCLKKFIKREVRVYWAICGEGK
jgi:hypothetical protein